MHIQTILIILTIQLSTCKPKPVTLLDHRYNKDWISFLQQEDEKLRDTAVTKRIQKYIFILQAFDQKPCPEGQELNYNNECAIVHKVNTEAELLLLLNERFPSGEYVDANYENNIESSAAQIETTTSKTDFEEFNSTAIGSIMEKQNDILASYDNFEKTTEIYSTYFDELSTTSIGLQELSAKAVNFEKDKNKTSSNTVLDELKETPSGSFKFRFPEIRKIRKANKEANMQTEESKIKTNTEKGKKETNAVQYYPKSKIINRRENSNQEDFAKRIFGFVNNFVNLF